MQQELSFSHGIASRMLNRVSRRTHFDKPPSASSAIPAKAPAERHARKWGVLFSFRRAAPRLAAILICLLLSALPSLAAAASVTLAWDPVAPAPSGYKLFMRTSSGSYNYASPAWQGATTTGTIDQLQPGQSYSFVARAFTAGSESGNSNEVQYTVPNNRPVADAGPDLAVNSGAGVTLDGRGSKDPDGSIASYRWTQTGGPAVSLTNGSTAQATFKAPSVTATTTLVFQLTVADAQGLSASDACTVTVVAQAPAPVDSDNDGVPDVDEINRYGTDPYNRDTDGDGVSDGDEIKSGTDPRVGEIGSGTGKIWIEAEEGDIYAPMQITAHTSASNGDCIRVPSGSGTGGYAAYRFDIQEAGSYWIWGRFLAPNGASNSFFISVNGESNAIWSLPASTAWQWARFGAAKTFQAGRHTILIRHREYNTHLDRLLITKDSTYVPEGEGEPLAGPATHVVIEAESGIPNRPMQVQLDPSASGQGYVWAPPGKGFFTSPSINAGLVEYEFSVSQSGDYRIWGRVRAPSGTDDSFFVAVDDGAYERWDTQRGTAWTWDLVNAVNIADPRVYRLTAGRHTLSVMQREDGTQLDKIVITNNPLYTPQGAGEPANPSQVAEPVTHVTLEAEDALIVAKFQRQSSAAASAGAFLWVPQGTGNYLVPTAGAGLAAFDFYVSESGDYRIWGRVLAPSSADDSFFVAMDDGTYGRWNTQPGTQWTWDSVAVGAVDPLLYRLQAGMHTFHLMQREDGTRIDKLIITKNLGFNPN